MKYIIAYDSRLKRYVVAERTNQGFKFIRYANSSEIASVKRRRRSYSRALKTTDAEKKNVWKTVGTIALLLMFVTTMIASLVAANAK